MDALKTFSMHITKSSQSDGEMLWAATNSDTSPDLYGERMTVALYKSMLGKINRNEPPPEAFAHLVTSDWWKGGMPYVSLAHYPDGNGKAVPGMPKKLYIDGDTLKAKGFLYDTKLGRAVWKSLRADENRTTPDKIRISIAFLDLVHKHGEDGQPFSRKSATDVCPQCLAGVGDKIYIDGYLVHLALTRVPVNPRTLMTVEKSMTKKTRKDDALSIVEDAEVVAEVEASAITAKSDVLVEMSDSDVPTPVVEEACSSDSPKDKKKMDEEEEEPTPEKKKSLTSEDVLAIAEAVKSLVTPAPAVAEPVAEKSMLEVSVEKLYDSVSQAVAQKNLTVEQRLETINPVLQELGVAITETVKSAVGVETAPVGNDMGIVLESLTSLTNSVKTLADEIAVLKAQQVAPPAQKIPSPRGINPQVQASLTTNAPVANPNSIANIVRRSVSPQLPLK